jgi:uncharacterized repeat protein (TIGR01451 family)
MIYFVVVRITPNRPDFLGGTSSPAPFSNQLRQNLIAFGDRIFGRTSMNPGIREGRMFWKHWRMISRVFVVVISLIGALPRTVNVWANPVYQASANDWPMLMHDPAHTGYTTEPLIPNPPSGQLHLKWKVGLGERMEITMQPIVVGGMVYVGVMNGKFYAINADSGQIAWVYQAGGAISHAAAVVEGTVYFGCEDGKVYALNAQTGAMRWTFPSGGPILSSPIVVAQTVLIGSFDGYLYALNTDGTLKWRYETGGKIWTSPAADETNNRVYFGSEDMYATCVALDDGEYIWRTRLQGISMRNTYPVVSGDTVVFTAVKPGIESYAPALHEDWPFPDPQGRGPVEVWNDFYETYPERRFLFYLDSSTGNDLWTPAQSRYTPLPIPYWGLIVPIVDPEGNAWLPASGGGGDHGLDHDDRLWKINLATGEYSQAGSQDEYMIRYDETGRHTMAGGKYYYTIDADVAMYDPQTRTVREIFGNGFYTHRDPLDPPPTVHLRRYGWWFGGGVSACSPLVIAGGVGYYTSYSWLYAITPENVPTPGVVDLGVDPTAGPPAPSLSYADFKAELETQVLQIIASGHVEPRPVYWGWTQGNVYSFWREGEVLASLARTLPYLDASAQAALRGYLQNEVSVYLLDEPYSYRQRCFVYGIEGVIDPCDSSDYPGQIRTHWFADDLNVVAENLYAMWAYAHHTGDWNLITNNWTKISQLFDRLRNSFDSDLGIIVERNPDSSPKRWHTPDFKINAQIAAMFGVSQMAAQQGDATTQGQAESMLNDMLARRAWMGQYVRTLYDDGTFHYTGPDELVWTMEVFPYQGYRDRDSDVRQVHWMDGERTEMFGFPRKSSSSTPGIISEDDPGSTGLYEDLLHFHSLYPELGQFLAGELFTEAQMYVDTVENLNPWWYWSDAAVAAQGGSENLYNHPHISAAMFQTKAYVLGEEFEELAPQLPWTFADSGFRDIYRLQNLVALLYAYGLQPEEARKEVSPTSADYGDTLTYTIILVGSGEPMTLTDSIPAGTGYVVHSTSVNPDLGTLIANSSQIAWTGTVTEALPFQVTFQVQVEVTRPTAIENTARLQLEGDANIYDLQAIAIANGYKSFLPQILKNWR